MRKIPPKFSLNPDPDDELAQEDEDDKAEDIEDNILSLGTSRSPAQERGEKGSDGTINPPFP
ncbi:MAG TPA: hypothetical protein VF629_23035 [Hymenobacter sp.]|jgi:hypothetical protein|uniref:hypothetical protein n=1 Tax=Hymenobacter sp. TaxID=1898978 RepID=UPI002EDA43F8